MKNKGFTLLELLAVIAIISVLTAVAIPVFSGSRDRAEAATCSANRRALLSQLSTQQLMQNRSAEDVFAQLSGQYKLNSARRTEYTCPSGGIFTLKNGKIHCSVHGGDEVENDNAADIGGTKVILSENVKTQPNRNANDRIVVKKGELFLINGKYYVAYSDMSNASDAFFNSSLGVSYYLPKINFDKQITPDVLGDGDTLSKISDYTIRSLLTEGSVYVYDGRIYVQTGTRSSLKNTDSANPADHPNVWTYFGEIA